MIFRKRATVTTTGALLFVFFFGRDICTYFNENHKIGGLKYEDLYGDRGQWTAV